MTQIPPNVTRAIHRAHRASVEEVQDHRITALQAENEKLRELLVECDWLLKWVNKDLITFKNTRLETEFFSCCEYAIERIQVALEPKP